MFVYCQRLTIKLMQIGVQSIALVQIPHGIDEDSVFHLFLKNRSFIVKD